MTAGNPGNPATSEILLCGASVRSLAASAVAIGLRPTCVDFFADHDLQLLLADDRGRLTQCISHFDELPQILHEVPSGIPLIWAGGLENHPDVLDLLSQRYPLCGAEPAVIRMVRDPLRLGPLLRDAGLLFPSTLRSEAEYAQLPPAIQSEQWIRKPLQSGGGIGISLLSPKMEQTRVPTGCCLQQFISGIPVSALYLATHDGTNNSSVELLGCSLQLTGWTCLHAEDFQYNGSFGPVSLPQTLTDEVHRAGQTIANWSKLRGVFGIDFVLKQGRPWILEVNPRITASHESFELTTRRHLIRDHMACFGYSVEIPHPRADSTQPEQVLRMIVYSSRCCVSDQVFGGYYQGNSAELPIGIRPMVSNDSAPASGRPFGGRPFGDTPRPSGRPSGGRPSGDTPRIFLADIPSAGQSIIVGSPLCSIYVLGGDLREIIGSVRQVTSGSGGADRGTAAEFLDSLQLSGQAITDSLIALETGFSENLQSVGTPEFLWAPSPYPIPDD